MNHSERCSEVQTAESVYEKAVKAELGRQFDTAYRNYIHSAELFLHLNRSTNKTSKDESRWNAYAEKAIQRAEKIKGFVERNTSSATVTRHGPSSTHADSEQYQRYNLTPVGIDYFSAHEQSYILKKGGLVNAITFPPWDDEPILPKVDDQHHFRDPDGQAALSPEQLAVRTIWKRAVETGGTPDPTVQRRVLPEEILQHVVTDCSICASISVCLEHNRRFGTTLVESAVVNNVRNSRSEGRYDIKVFFNGTWRRIGLLSPLSQRHRANRTVVVDDLLPFHPQHGSLMCMSVLTAIGEPECIWPSILEKAYIKLMGGYDFPGSNSSIDLHSLAGWIPEHIEIRGSQFERERSWKRVLQGFTDGNCMVTLGTGTATKSWQGVVFLPSHSYAVIDFSESNETRTLTLLDTWVNPDHELQRRQLAGRVEIPWFDVLNTFDGIYLSWDPSIWANDLTNHGMWNRGGSDDNVRQYHVNFTSRESVEDQEIWVLLTRHLVNTKRTSDFMSLKVDIEDSISHDAVVHNHLVVQGTYTNSTHVLVRTPIPASFHKGVLSIVPCYEGDATEVGFTLTVYAGSSFAIEWDETTPAPPFIKKIDGVLSNKNSGGNCTYPTFMLNPQYYLRILPIRGQSSAKARVTFSLQTGRDTPVNISVTWSQGERIYELARKDLTVSSGAYAYGLARVSKDLAAGDYTIIVSAFEARQMGDFKLKVESSQPIELSSIPQEGAGMYLKTIRGAWDTDSAMGGPTSKQYLRNPTFQISVPTLCQVKMRLQLLRPSTSAPLNLTLFLASRSDTLGRHITTSGAYSAATCGVVTPQVTLSPGKYWAIPSTYNPGVEAGFQLLLYTTAQNVQITERESESE